ncbi:energy-coupling factor transporter transmembrane component T family protein [Desertibacillus haloalkaliphilus]|uniref:energy-coupling factor transporter transmembrane component T family protein n=1 Tax=Desertibacillus haloalkaliphilus TaxID=1328930 RepID=UPI001C25F499|nr:energy-coupling factor transporter transmembrane component T [Desertibacillus haloalkaliphilus]MBU8908585.1 energy-coupling factor transporter transmembrane protein EcfT [Desertibacillus haloalkaliphilus]
MFQNIIIGQYVSKESVIHRLDPRAKLAAIFILVIITFLANNWLSYGILASVAVVAILLSKVPVRFIYKGLKPIFIIIIFTFLLHLLLTKEGELIFTVGWFEVYEGGIMQGAFISLRLLLLVMITSLLTLTTTPIDLTDGLEFMLNPLKRVGLPAHELALMMSIALRFIPTLLQETEKISKAQMARGVDFTTGPFKERAKAIIPLLIPLFISSFKRAEELALAMESRGYRGGEGRTKLRQLQWRRNDTVLFIFILVIAIILLILRL